MKDFYEELLDNDLNPYLLFYSNGKIKSYNKEAEFLLSFVSVKELFDLAVENASLSFGFNQKYISLKYNKQAYYAILVGYVNEQEIALRLYKVVSNDTNSFNNKELKLVNIFSLIELSKNSTLINSNLEISELYDISIPELKININNFLLCLNDCFSLFKNEEKLSLQVHIKTGEYEITDGKKYKILVIKYISDKKIVLEPTFENALELKAKKSNVNLFYNHNILKLQLPMIL
jgi:nitrogen-specific signal transduction histidine kinase